MTAPGILSLQGAFEAHGRVLNRLGAAPVYVKTLKDLEHINSLIIPGGESTVMIKLLKRLDLLEPLKEKIHNGLPVLGTCAGMILLSKGIEAMEQETLGIMDIRVRRNGYGRQKESFETELQWNNQRLRGIFIRAPRVLWTGSDAEILVTHQEDPVLIRQGNALAAGFHPELSDSDLLHKYFLDMRSSNK